MIIKKWLKERMKVLHLAWYLEERAAARNRLLRGHHYYLECDTQRFIDKAEKELNAKS